MNFLEHLVAEWYDKQGYLIKTNIVFSKLPGVGYETYLDLNLKRIIGFD